MPKQLTAGKAATILIDLVDDNGSSVIATAVSWKLFDARGVELFDGTCDTFAETDTYASVVLTELQTVSVEPLEGREVILYCTTADDEVEVREFVLLVASAPLELAVNSFQTFTEAQVTRAEFARLDGWDASAKNLQIAAMREAHRRILRVTLQLTGAVAQNSLSWPSRRVPLASLTAAEFDTLPAAFKSAVKRAQLVESDVLLGGDKIGDKRREGIVSETIGESSMFLNSKPYLNLPISKKAYEELKAFAVFIVTVARA